MTAARAERAGGLVENDWFTIIWPKVNWLARAVGLEPWYKSAAAVAPPPTAPPPQAATSPAPAVAAPTPAAPCTVAASLATPWQNGNSGPLNNVINLVRFSARAAPGPPGHCQVHAWGSASHMHDCVHNI